MKKLTAFLLACFLLSSVAFASPIMPLSGTHTDNATLTSGQTWTSGRYGVPTSDTKVTLSISVNGGNVTAELYGANSVSGSGTKVGSINTATGSTLSVSRNYTHYYVKAMNNSGVNSTVQVTLTTR